MAIKPYVKEPIIEGLLSVRFKVRGNIVGYANEHGIVGSVYSADLAEAFRYDNIIVKSRPNEGTVMVVNPTNGLVIPSYKEKDSLVVGVIVYQPGIFLGGHDKWEALFEEGYLPVALIGQVNVLVNKDYRYEPGMLLTTDINGKAKPTDSRCKSFGIVLKVIDNEKVKVLIK